MSNQTPEDTDFDLLRKVLLDSMNQVLVGTRIRLKSCPDPYTKLSAGEEGTIKLIDDFGTLHVKWDNGSTLGLVPGVDSWEVIE